MKCYDLMTNESIYDQMNTLYNTGKYLHAK